MARLRCPCGGMEAGGFVYEGNGVNDPCPRCGRAGPAHIAKLVDVHFVVMDHGGPILGSVGRQYVACQRRRDHLAAHEYDTFAATDEAPVVTCQSCRGTKEWQEAAKKYPEIAEIDRVQKLLHSDCCG